MSGKKVARSKKKPVAPPQNGSPPSKSPETPSRSGNPPGKNHATPPSRSSPAFSSPPTFDVGSSSNSSRDPKKDTGSGSGKGRGKVPVKGGGTATTTNPPPAAREMGADDTGNQHETYAHSMFVPAGATQEPLAFETAQDDLQILKDRFSQTKPSRFRTMDSEAVAESIAAQYADYTDAPRFLSTASFIKAFLEENTHFTAETILSDTAGFEEKLTEAMACVADDNPMKYDLPPKLIEYLQAIKDRDSMPWLFKTLKTLFGQ